jgi:hypothetical protein
MWLMENGAESAIEALRTLYLPPTRHLELARLYHIEAWVDSVFNLLLGEPLKELSDTEQEQLGYDLYKILALANESLHHYHLSIAYQAPDLKFDDDISWEDCSKHAQCEKVGSTVDLLGSY